MSWPLDFDPRIAAPSDEARSAAVGRGGDRRVMSECENERRRMWAESSRSVPPSGASSTSCRWCGAAGRVYCGVPGRVGIEHVARGRDEQLQARLAALQGRGRRRRRLDQQAQPRLAVGRPHRRFTKTPSPRSTISARP